jgi:hypothetical protein
MKKRSGRKEAVVRTPKIEKLWVVQYATVRRHSRVLYLPLDPTTVRLYELKKGDIIKYQTLELRRAPEGDEEEL